MTLRQVQLADISKRYVDEAQVLMDLLPLVELRELVSVEGLDAFVMASGMLWVSRSTVNKRNPRQPRVAKARSGFQPADS